MLLLLLLLLLLGILQGRTEIGRKPNKLVLPYLFCALCEMDRRLAFRISPWLFLFSRRIPKAALS